MTAHVEEELVDFLLGALPPAVAAQVESHLARCARCAAERAALADTLGELAFALPPAADDGSGRRALLLAARAPTAHGGRFCDFVSPVATLLDLETERAAALLDWLDAPDTDWQPVPLRGAEGIRAVTPPKGPRRADAFVTLLLLSPGARYPEHAHLGQEQVLVLQGGFIDEAAGKQFEAGALCTMAAGSAHGFRALPGPDCICLGIAEGGIRLLGEST